LDKPKIQFLTFNLVFLLSILTVFFFSELNNHMLFFVNLTQSGGALRYSKFSSSHLILHAYLDFFYSLGFSGKELINLLKALVLGSFYLSALLLYKRAFWAILFLLFPPIFYLLLIFEDNLLYLPIVIIWFDLLFNQKEKRSPLIAVALGFLLGFSTLINAINSIFLFFLIGLIFTEGLLKKSKVDTRFWSIACCSFIASSLLLAFPLLESFEFHPFMEVFPRVFRLERGITAGVTQMTYLESLNNSLIKLSPYIGTSLYCFLIALGLYLFKSKNLSFFICSSAFLFFGLYVEPDSPERYDYFFTICFMANLNSFDKRSKVLVLIFISFLGIIFLSGKRHVEENKELWAKLNSIPKTVKAAYIPFKYKSELPSFSAYLPNATKNTYLYLTDKSGRCHYMEQNQELLGFWDMTSTTGIDEMLCLRNDYSEETIVIK
tara:strand:+ start:238236 stop:239540 length:1305 start_codon:yes stop_codon:yes gene_type:complete